MIKKSKPVAHILENAAWDYIPFEPAAEECVKNADVVYFDTLALRKAYSQATILDLIDATSENCLRFFDINLRQNYFSASLIEKLLQRADVLKLNVDELNTIKTLFGFDETNESLCLKIKSEYNLKYLILSDVAKCSRIWGEEGLTTVKNQHLEQVFAHGAGNAFAGTFISAIMKGSTQQEAHEQANAVAADVCKHTLG